VTEKPKHEALERVSFDDGCMVFAGRKVSAIADEVGSTPFYAYDSDAMRKRVEMLRQKLPSGIEIHYAVKANPMPEVVRLFAGAVDGLDVASVGELEVALAAGAEPGSISFAGPGKTPAELRRGLEAGIVINLESETEMRRVAELGAVMKVQPRVAVRVNPDFELKTSGMKMSGGPKQFGIDAERVPAVLKQLSRLEVEFVGFHIFSGSQNLRPESIVEAQTRTVELAVRLAASAPGPVLTLNIGGGFGIPYFPGDVPLDLEPIARNLDLLLERSRRELGGASLVIELGRYLVGECGIYVCQILDRKVSRGHTFYVTDGGLHHHLAASGNFGQVLRKNYPVLIATRPIGSASQVTASVVGPLCTPLDLLADRMLLPEADIGDLVVVLQSGAYGYTASPLGFLSHAIPAQIML
jgi:diaminopimelate decarboxylase